MWFSALAHARAAGFDQAFAGGCGAWTDLCPCLSGGLQGDLICMNAPADLRAEVRALRLLVSDLSERVTLLEDQLASRGSGGNLSAVVELSSAAQRRAPSVCPSSADYTFVSEPIPTVIEDCDTLREEAAKQTGLFFKRSLEGLPRGPSGRDRVSLANNFYVLVRDRQDKIYDPVRIFHRFSDLKPWVGIHGGFGNSIFAGFHSEWEARLATLTAGLTYPASGD